MITKRKASATVLSFALLAALGCSEDAQNETASTLVPGGGDAVTIWTEELELFFEYPPLVAGSPGEPWAIRLTTLADFQPVSEGTLTLRFEAPDGSVLTEIEDAPARPGIYTHAPSFAAAGMYDLVMEYRGQGMVEEIFVGPVQVFGSQADLPLLPEEPAVGISFLKEQQWPIEFATVRAATRVVTPGVRVTGEVVGAWDGVAQIAAPVEGIIRWEENRNAPPEGAPVSQGEPLVRLSLVGGDNNFAVLASRAELLKQEVARAERLVAAEAVPAGRLDEARLELEVVQAQLEAINASSDGGYTLTLRAPISGTVSDRNFTLGQRVAAGEPLFTLFDPRRVWIRFHLPASQVSKAGSVTAATFSQEGSKEVFRTERVVTVATTLDLNRRTLPVTLEADNSGGELKPGMLVHGRLLLSDPEPTLAVPAEAVTDENGIMVVYVQIGGETFERRAVSVGETDGLWTTVLSGIRPGEYVVTRGGYQLRLSSLNTSEISDHGHVH